MTKHTKGPWKVVESSADDYTLAVVMDDEVACEVASVYTDGTSTQQARADARLIAAAPDLLTAAEDALVELESWEYGESEQDAPALGVIARLRAAIAKARGAEE